MKERGSITVFFSLLLPFFLIILLLLSELSYYHFLVQREISKNYLEIDHMLSGYNRELFNEMGLFAFKGRKGLAPLSDREILEESILLLMKEAHLRDGIYLAENLSSELLKTKVGIDFELFDLGGLNRELSSIVSRAKRGELSESIRIEFFAKALAMQPYIHIRGISLYQLEKYISEGNIKALEEINPIFVLDDGIRDNYYKWQKSVKKFDLLNLLGSYALADYGVDYLGYSMTKKEREDLRSEYILTGLAPGSSQENMVKAELFSLRLLLNLIECFSNPTVRDRILSLSGGEPTLFTVFALAQAGLESKLDVKQILKREKVPLYKGREGFRTLGKVGPYQKGWTYPEYLKILLGLVSKEVYFSRLSLAIEENYDILLEFSFTGMQRKKLLSFKGNYLPFEIEKEIEGRLYYVPLPEG
ncbi:MAG TPA: DUF5702 domain-containing protein [Clostridia bacterium]|nr:DUF5702 domain-containing protein [Clostridia bacterium]